MEDDQWHDPLLITDVWQQQQHKIHCQYPLPSLQTLKMADPDDYSPNKIDGRSVRGFSLTSTDLVICTESPDIPTHRFEDSSELLRGTSMELSLENGINGSEMKDAHETSAASENLTLLQASRENVYSDASFELLLQLATEENLSESSISSVSINSGSTYSTLMSGGIKYLEDSCFSGGDSIKTDARIGDGEGLTLYQTARYGNCLYYFKNLETGNYIVDLHLAEIVFTEGPPGMRVFDVFIQEQKVVSCLDIYALVGANRPLVISGLKTLVNSDKDLTMRFEGVTGSPIICGIALRKDISPGFEVELLNVMEMSEMPPHDLPKDCGYHKVEGEYGKLQIECECQRMELVETRKALEMLKTENEKKSRECQKACKSLRELQNELMRKSMHVGSLAFAVEGQVKEKSKWFSSLRDLSRKLKILKVEQMKLSEEAVSYKKGLEDMDGTSSLIQSKINQEAELHEDLKRKFVKGAKERKVLYNKILELKGNIRVFCRCRPLHSEEVAAGASMAIDFEAAKDGELTVKSNVASKKTLKFDAVFGPQANQVDVFEDTAPFATSVLDGYNVCIFAYGQTGTGKTFTIEGTDEARGVNFRTLQELFRIIDERKKQFRFEICVSVLEVYNEQIRDLLVSRSQPDGTKKRLEIRQVGEGIHHVPGLVEAHVNNMSEVWEVLQTGSNARAVGSTNANEYSSRSHCIHCVMVKGENLLNGECTRSKLWLVDLAGSERIAKTEVQGERLKETQNINRSLSALGDVISSLATKSPHIPFRNSKLTHLLQDSLGGDSKTLMFVQISPNENDLSETLCSLNFSSRVRGIELGPAKKQLDSSELIKYKQLVEKTKQEMKSKEVQIKKMEDTMHGFDLKMKEKDLKNKNLQDKIKELESQLLIERKLARQHVDTKIAEQQQQQQMRQQQEEHNSASILRPPLSTKPFGTHKNNSETKDQTNTRPLTENNSNKFPTISAPPIDGGLVKPKPMEKENNNPEAAAEPFQRFFPQPKQTGRASICTTANRTPALPAPRRNSLIPLPSEPGTAKFRPPFLPLTTIQAMDAEECPDVVETKCLPEPASWEDSPKEQKVGAKKLGNILRRSMQKRIQMKSPMQAHARRGGVNVGMEKVRVSIGSRGKMHRVLLGNARRGQPRDIQQKQNQKEKEKGWNSRTVLYN